MYNLMHNDIKCNDVYLHRCFNYLILLTFTGKVKISEINIISCGYLKNNMGYRIIEKKLRDTGIRKKFVRDTGIEIPYLIPPFTLDIFINLSKAFGTVDHSILIKKLKLYEVKGNNLRWFESCLSNRKQYISYNGNKCTTFESITYGVPQGSIVGPLLFLVYVNDLPNATNILDPIMFADDKNLFYSHHDIKTLFSTVNEELEKLAGWFTGNRLSMSIKTTKYTFFP